MRALAPAAEINQAAAKLRGADPAAVVAWAVERFGERIAVASSFSVEDCVVIDLVHKASAATRASSRSTRAACTTRRT